MSIVPSIKICGLTRTEDVVSAEDAGACYLGGVMAGGPRNLGREKWRDVLGPRRARVLRVCVMGQASVREIVLTAQYLDVDIIQWHSDTDSREIRAVLDEGVLVWPVLRISDNRLPLRAWELADLAGVLVLDAKVPGVLGGSGVALDWEGLSSDIEKWRRDIPNAKLVLAGGLNAGNVRAAIDCLSPDVVDVSSGVESRPGIKNANLIREFATAVRG